MISVSPSKLHWNYFIALDKDMETASRYVEFAEANFGTYSIEMARILFAAASEVDALAKMLCRRLAPLAPRENILHYKPILMAAFPDLPRMNVIVPRYGLTLTPWENWRGAHNPNWWRSYNNVKHGRDAYFHEATLHSALNALGGLLILVYNHYRYELSEEGAPLSPKDATRLLKPDPSLMQLPYDFYYANLIA